MLKISSEQIRIFQPDAEEAFVQRTAEYLRKNHPDSEVYLLQKKFKVAEISNDFLFQAVRSGIKHAQNFGISWKSTLLSFVVLMFLTAPNFFEYPKAESFLQQTETIDDEKFESFLEIMTDEDWEQVEANYDEKVWNLPVVEGEKI
ncbi:MAG: hypothetical protein K1X72_02280 [Pyrinomonadaceae bacterium]|nr:hypothetical protein [Pyrinomonadaceae bacterium]